MNQPGNWLGSGFVDSWQRSPKRPALEVQGELLSYDDLYGRAAALADLLREHTPGGGAPLTAVFAARSAPAFAGVLAALFRGHGYVPLNPAFPAARTRTMLERSDCRAVIVDEQAIDLLDEVLEGVAGPVLLVCPEGSDVRQLARRWRRHIVLEAGHRAPSDFRMGIPDESDVAYLLFTSGSTGTPKGVAVSHRNIARFLDVMLQRYQLDEHDRSSQMFDLVFDLSLFDMFMTWKAGACLCCPSKQEVLLPYEYVRNSRLTVWFSVPSVGVLMNRLGLLEPDSFPNLRVSLFAGEALSAEIPRAWAAAAPNSIVENLYGPTEVTLACMLYRWNGEPSERECADGIVPIGEPYPGMTALVANAELEEVAPGKSGELLMSGPQVALGYWRDPAQTERAFTRPPGRDAVFYRTGDLVRRPTGSDPMVYLGRIDHQIKIHGSRVELGEIEAVLKEAAGGAAAVAVGWPVNPSGADGIVAFLEGKGTNVDEVKRAAKACLPHYMVPKEIRLVAEFPLTSNGKIDRQALFGLLRD